MFPTLTPSRRRSGLRSWPCAWRASTLRAACLPLLLLGAALARPAGATPDKAAPTEVRTTAHPAPPTGEVARLADAKRHGVTADVMRAHETLGWVTGPDARAGRDTRAARGSGVAETVVRHARRGGTIGGPDPLLFDQRVSSSLWSSGTPAIASASDGTLYAVNEDLDSAYLDLYSSSNGGFTWLYMFSIYAPGDPRSPSVVVAEGNTDRLLVAFVEGSGTAAASIKLFWLDLDTQLNGLATVSQEPFATLSAPRLCVDSPEYAYWYPYVVWSRTIVGRGTTTNVALARSFDFGETFQASQTLATNVSSGARPDIDYGYDTLYVVFTRDAGAGNRDVYLRRSGNFGANFDTEVGIAINGQDEFGPRVAVTVDGSLAAIAFTRRYTISNGDIESYVTTDGSSWLLRYLPYVGLDETDVDLTASRTDPTIHAVFDRSQEIRSSWLRTDSPGFQWSEGRRVNEGAFALPGHPPAIAANPVRPGEAAMAWTSATPDNNAVIFDAEYPVGDYVIVLADVALTPAIQPLVDWKRSIGYGVTVTTVEQIFEQYASGDDAERIRAYLADASADARHVLLVGDVDLLPMRMLYPSDTRPAYGSDFYYADVSTGNWDLDADNRWGEFIDDSFDYHPDLLVGRLPFDDAPSVQAFANNVVAFEQESASWKRNVLFSHGFMDHEPHPQGIGTDAAYVSEGAIAGVVSPNGWGDRTQYEEGGIHTSAFTSDDALMQVMYRSNVGWGSHGIVNAMSHGSRTHMASIQWKADYDEDFTADAAEEYTYNWFSHWNEIAANPAVGLVNLFGCSTGALLGVDPCFDASPLRSLYLIRLTQPNMMMKEYLRHGAGSVIGATAGADYSGGWMNPSDGRIQSLATYFFEALATGSQRAGDALHAAAVRYADTHGLARGLRVFHCFGDPTLTIKDLTIPGGAPRTVQGIVSAPPAPPRSPALARGGSCPPSSVDWSKVGELGELGGVPTVFTLLGTGGELLACGMATVDSDTNQGVVFRSLDDGETWARHDVPSAWSIRSIVRTSTGRLVAAGSSESAGILSGAMYTSDDDGTSWALRHEEAGEIVADLVIRPGGDLVAVTHNGGHVYRSDTDGTTWAQLASFGDGVSLSSITEISGRLFVTLDEPDTFAPIQRSFDGVNWEPATGLAQVAAAHDVVRAWDGVYYTGVRSTSGQGFVYESADEGLTWSLVTELPDLDIVDVLSLTTGPDGTLYAGASTGWGPSAARVYGRAPGSVYWERVGSELDLANHVRALAVHGPNLYAGTGDIYGQIFAIAHEVTVDVPESAPAVFAARAPRPNPFGTETVIGFSLPRAADVTARVFDARGREVRTLAADEHRLAGEHTLVWDGRDSSGRDVPAGVYFYRLETPMGQRAGRMVLTR